MLNVQSQSLGTVSLLNLEGNFVVGETDRLREVVQDLPVTRTIILDFSRVSLVDAHGLGVMLQLREQAETRQMRFELMNVRDRLRELLQITRLDSVFSIRSEVESFAIAA